MDSVDRNARDKLAHFIEAYLEGDISNFEFDESINAIESNDPLIDFCVQYLWYFYDDIKEHKVCITKEGWDFHYRILLLLRSNRSVSIQKERVPFKECMGSLEEDRIDSLFPFEDFRQLMAIRRETDLFQKKPYIPARKEEEIWSDTEQKWMQWTLVVSFPIVLLFKIMSCLFYREKKIIINPKGTP